MDLMAQTSVVLVCRGNDQMTDALPATSPLTYGGPGTLLTTDHDRRQGAGGSWMTTVTALSLPFPSRLQARVAAGVM